MQKHLSLTCVAAKSNLHPFHFRWSGALLWTCLFFLCGPATAAIIYQNYDGVNADGAFEFVYQQDNAPPTPDFGRRAGIAFTTDGSSYLLDSVTVNMELNAGGITLRLYSNSGGVPGSFLGLLATPGGIGAPDNYTFGGAGLLLDANTTYWVVMEPGVAPTSAQWYRGTSPGPAAVSDSVDNVWNPWVGGVISGPPSALIMATPVPEPINVALGILGGLFVVVHVGRHARVRAWLLRRNAAV